MKGFDKSVKYLGEHGADVNSRSEDRSTPLLYAARYARTACIKVLVKLGADVNATNRSGHTPLIYSAEKENFSE